MPTLPRIAEAAAIAHQTASQDKLTECKDRRQRMAGRQRRELFYASVVEVTVANQDRTNALLGQSWEGRFEIAVGSGIHNNELQVQRTRRPLQVCDHRLGSFTRLHRYNGPTGVR